MVRLGRLFTAFNRVYLDSKKRQYSRPKFFTSKNPIVPYEDRNKLAIYHGKGLRVGFEETFSGKKTRRIWKPNVISKEYWSDLMQESFPVRITTHAMRCLDKAGGFDNYMLRTRERWMTTRKTLDLKNYMVQTNELKIEHPDQSIDDIKKKVKPPRPPIANNRVYTNRFYFDMRGRKQMVFC